VHPQAWNSPPGARLGAVLAASDRCVIDDCLGRTTFKVAALIWIPDAFSSVRPMIQNRISFHLPCPITAEFRMFLLAVVWHEKSAMLCKIVVFVCFNYARIWPFKSVSFPG
jgi:hypothetical protein